MSLVTLSLLKSVYYQHLVNWLFRTWAPNKKIRYKRMGKICIRSIKINRSINDKIKFQKMSIIAQHLVLTLMLILLQLFLHNHSGYLHIRWPHNYSNDYLTLCTLRKIEFLKPISWYKYSGNLNERDVH